MEYCPMNLRDHMNSTPKFPEQEISYMLEQLARGLEFLHSHDIVHMDVKPGTDSLSMTAFSWLHREHFG